MPIVTKRFTSWRLTGGGFYEGILPIPEGQEPDQYVELDYDGTSVVAVREFLRGHERPLSRKPTLDAKRRLAASDYTDPSSGLQGRNVYSYDPKGFLCSRKEIDPQGRTRFRIDVTCDAKGWIKEEQIFDRHAKLSERHVYEHDARGNQLTDTVFDAKGKKKGEYRVTFDEKDRPITHAYFAADGQLNLEYRYKYDALNRRTEIALHHGPTPDFVTRFTYDAKGRRIRSEHLDAAGKPLGGELRPLDERGQSLLDGGSLGDVIQFTASQLESMRHAAFGAYEAGMFERARDLYAALTNLDGTDALHPVGAAVACLAMNDKPEARVWFDRALARDPGCVQGLVGKAELVLHEGDTGQAMQLFTRAFAATEYRDDPAIVRARLIVEGLVKAAQAPRP